MSNLMDMPLQLFEGWLDVRIEKSLKGEIMPREEIIALLGLPASSPHADMLRRKAGALAHSLSGGRGKIWSAVGVDRRPCPMSCSFCSLGERWGLVTEESEWPDEDVLEAARLAVQGGASWFVLRTTEFYGTERLLALAAKVAPLLGDRCSLAVNTGELDSEGAARLASAGVRGVYHTLRLGEGRDTCFAPEERLATLSAVHGSALELYHMAEPLGPEHSDEEIADRILVGLEHGAALGGVMARIGVKGMPTADIPPVPEDRLALITAVCRIAGGAATPDICTVPPSRMALESGANVVTVEVGAIPRSGQVEHGSSWNGFGLEQAAELLRSAGYGL